MEGKHVFVVAARQRRQAIRRWTNCMENMPESGKPPGNTRDAEVVETETAWQSLAKG